jgi:hypothetical protein
MIVKRPGASYRVLWQEKDKDIEGVDFFSLEVARDVLEFRKFNSEFEGTKYDLEPIITNIKPYEKYREMK